MTPEIFIKRQLNAKKVDKVGVVQSLWSGYGEIARYRVSFGAASKTVMLKHVALPEQVVHPRGWQSDHAHQRKVISYDVEATWYRDWAALCSEPSQVAHCYGVLSSDGLSNGQERFILMEDLDAAGYALRHQRLTASECLPCLTWLGSFHGHFLQTFSSEQGPQGLWSRGTYWHLSTRQEEWQAMAEGELKQQAETIEACLANAHYQTLVHGDAKVANFCFSEDGRQVAAVDFQYVGAGIGVQDVVYFLGSALTEDALKDALPYLLEHYFAELGQAIMAKGESQALASAVIEEWQGLFAIAWADFQRFILGWSPNHIKNTAFSRQLTTQALAQLNSQSFSS